MLKVQCFPVGELQANCYFVSDEASGVSLLIDTGAPSSQMDMAVERFGSEKLRYILLTHGHFDHIGNTAAVKRAYPAAKIVIGREEEEFTSRDTLNLSLYFEGGLEHFKPDILVDDGDVLPFGNEEIRVISTPGHTRGGVCYLIGSLLFTGDTIISGTTGRMDFPTGSSRDMVRSVAKLARIKGNPRVYCGHGESSTLDEERKNNIFMEKACHDDLY